MKVNSIVKSIFHKFGFSISKLNSTFTPIDFHYRLKNQKIPLEVFFDIGAHNGSYTEIVKKVWPNSRSILFEANPIHRESLIQSGADFYLVALGQDREQKLFYGIGGTGDSLYRENYDNRYLSVAPRLVETVSLDGVMGAKHLPQPDFLKIDVQGAELDVLLGGRNTITKSDVLTVEVSLVNYNSGGAKIADILEVMSNYGFMPFDVAETHKIEKCLIQVDLAFINLNTADLLYGKSDRRFLA